jgi:NADPH-dependent curcumin reductase CurA
MAEETTGSNGQGQSRQVRLAARPDGLPQREHWNITTEPIPTAGPGEVVVRIDLISLDPAQRLSLYDRPSYAPPVEIDAVMGAGTIGEVIESQHPDFAVGDRVSSWLGVREHAVSDGTGLQKLSDRFPLDAQVGVLGMTGMTAYFGLLETGQLKDGETVVVSGAAGATGSVVGQIAKIKGCRVIGVAGGPEKCRHVVEELGFDACIDYKSDDVAAELARLAPDGVDVYFDNVGGDVLDAVLLNLAMHARIVICGAISQYNTEKMTGPSNYWNLLVRRSRMEGFLVGDFYAQWDAAREQMGEWLDQGKMHYKTEIVDGTIEDFPVVFQRLFRGENTGKLMLRLNG